MHPVGMKKRKKLGIFLSVIAIQKISIKEMNKKWNSYNTTMLELYIGYILQLGHNTI